MSVFRSPQYTSQFGLTPGLVDYLNLSLPNISNIFRTPTTTTTTPAATTSAAVGLTPEQLALLMPQQNLSNDGDDRPMGIGAFGNLDPSTLTQMEVAKRNAAGEMELTMVDVAKNFNTGAFQTLDGKNVRHAGIEMPSMFSGIASMLGFDPNKKREGDIGSISELETLKAERDKRRTAAEREFQRLVNAGIMGIDTDDDDEEISFPNYGPPGIGSTPQEIFASNLFNPRPGAGSTPGSRMSPFGDRDRGSRITPKEKPTPTNVNRPGGDDRPGGFGQGAGSFRESDPTATEGSF
tara:strand:+ start:400 stop:1281 length:882 start_codon:yes stop_codon:yes gene_type:complete